MVNSSEIRWQQRHENFGQALDHLSKACALEELNELEQTGLIKSFELSFELAWIVMKDFLFYEGLFEHFPRTVIKKSFEAHYIAEKECEILLDALEKRNLLSHTYGKDRASSAVELIRNDYFPVLESTYQKLGTKRTA